MKIVDLSFASDGKCFATFDVDEKLRRVRLEVRVNNAAIVKALAPLLKVEVVEFSDEDAAELARLRVAFEKTKTQRFSDPQDRARAQLDLQAEIGVLEKKDRMAKIERVVADQVAAAASSPAPATKQEA